MPNYTFRDNETGEEFPYKCETPFTVVWEKTERSEPEPIKELSLDYKHNFVMVSQLGPRKNFENTISWFIEEFIDQEVGLVVKTNFRGNTITDYGQVEKHLKTILTRYPDRKCKIYLLHGDLSSGQMTWLYSHPSISALINISHGEGFGLPIAEAMLMKLPVITTAWGGQMDFCNSDNCWLVDFKFSYTNTHFNLFNSVWAQPILDDLSRCMKELYYADKVDISKKIENAKLTIDSYTWEKVVNINLDFFEKLKTNYRPNNALVGFVTPWNQKCGIFTYSQNLFKNFDHQVHIFAPDDQSLIQEDEDFVNRCWFYEEDQLTDLIHKIILSRLKTVVIQFNFGFFDFKAFANLIKSLKRECISIIIIFHSTKSPINNTLKDLKLIVNELTLCDRLLVHSPNDLNNMKAIGLINNVSLFPHGVNISDNLIQEVLAQNQSLSSKKLRIASFGYCLPDKGFDQLILACKYLNESYINTDLYIYSSVYSSQYQYLVMELNDLISRNSLNNKVKICFDYLPEYEITRELVKADLIVYPYQNSNESSSAAVRNGLKSGSPIAITPLGVFQDVEQIAYVLSGFSAQELSIDIKNWHENEISKSYEQIKCDKQNIINWLDQFDFKKVALRLENMIEAL